MRKNIRRRYLSEARRRFHFGTGALVPTRLPRVLRAALSIRAVARRVLALARLLGTGTGELNAPSLILRARPRATRCFPLGLEQMPRLPVESGDGVSAHIRSFR